MTRIIFPLVLLLAAVAQAQQPKAVITGPRESAAGDLVVLDASESVGTSRLWLLAVAPVPKSFLPVDSGLRCVFATGTPGKYVFVLVVAGTNANGGAAAEMATHELVIGGGTPQPNPIDPPDPPPIGQVSRAVIVEETAERTPEQAAVLTSPLLQTLRKSGKLIVLDKDAKDSQGQPALELSQYDAQPLPRVLGLDSAGVRSAAAELPGTVDELLKLLADWGVK